MTFFAQKGHFLNFFLSYSVVVKVHLCIKCDFFHLSYVWGK